MAKFSVEFDTEKMSAMQAKAVLRHLDEQVRIWQGACNADPVKNDPKNLLAWMNIRDAVKAKATAKKRKKKAVPTHGTSASAGQDLRR